MTQPLPPVPPVGKDGTSAHAWQRWFLQLRDTAQASANAAVNSGRYQESTGVGTALTTTTITPIASLVLPAGDWDVSGVVQFQMGSGAQCSELMCGTSSSSSAFGAVPGSRVLQRSSVNTVGWAQLSPEIAVPTVRYNLSSPSTVYLLAYAAFAVAGITAVGNIRARSFS